MPQKWISKEILDFNNEKGDIASYKSFEYYSYKIWFWAFLFIRFLISRGCGSCTVVVGSFDMSERIVKYVSVNSCLAPLCSMHLKHVITIEGLGNSSNIHPIQKALATTHSSQCGYCTPGIVMSLFAQLKENPKSSEEEAIWSHFSQGTPLF